MIGPRRVFFAALIASVLVLGVLPARQLVAHRAQMGELSERLDELKKENSGLAKRVSLLSDDKTVRVLARENLGFVEPGEEAYLVVEAPKAEPRIELPEPTRPSTASKIWRWLTGTD